MSVLDKNGLGDWLADHLVEIGDTRAQRLPAAPAGHRGPVPRRAAAREEPADRAAEGRGREQRVRREEGRLDHALPQGGRGGRHASRDFRDRQVGQLRHRQPLPDDRRRPLGVDQSRARQPVGPLRSRKRTPQGTRIKAAIQEAGNVSTAIGLVSQSASVDPDKFAGVWAISGTYGAFTPLMYTPARVWSQQSQDSKFKMGVLHILVGHSGPETAADGRTHFGIFAPQVWKLFPRGQAIHLNFWDYNDVAPAYFAAAEIAAREPKVGIITLEVARPDFAVADRSDVCGHGSARRRQGLLSDSRLHAGQAASRLRRDAGIELDGEPGERSAEARGGRHQRARDRGDQRGAVRSPAGGVPSLGAAARGVSTI